MNSRENFNFPTRQYPYHVQTLSGLLINETSSVKYESNRLYKFILGIDLAPVEVEDSTFQNLNDPFSELLLKHGLFPLTLKDLLENLDKVNDTARGLPLQKSFLVADGGQIEWTPETAHINRLFRFVITRAKETSVDLMISSSTVTNSDTNFLQLIGWDPIKEAYNFYERREGTWIWAGDSNHALNPETRGRGPFDSHVNGALVMKELKVPWSNWHSMSASIQNDVLEPGDPLTNEPLYRNKISAHELENSVVKPGIRRWNRARLKRAKTLDNTLNNMHYFFRQILESTTVNLITSKQQSKQITNESLLILPPTFFINSDALIDQIGLEPDISPVQVSGSFYRDCLEKYEFRLTDGTFEQKGDTFFAFLVPEPAFEDLDVLALLLHLFQFFHFQAGVTLPLPVKGGGADT